MQDDLGLVSEIDFSKLPMNEADMAEAAKLFEECMKNLGDVQQENPNMENPFLAACNQMFKDFEQIQKDDVKKTAPSSGATGPTSGMPTGGPGLGGFPGMPPGMGGLGGLGGMPGMEGMENDPTFMNLLNTFAKDLLSGDANQSDAALDGIMNQF